MRKILVTLGLVAMVALLAWAFRAQAASPTQPQSAAGTTENLVPSLAGAEGASRSIPACAGRITPIPRPDALPASFPLPPGSVITGQQALGQGLTVLAVAPMDAHSVALYWAKVFPGAGFRSGQGDSEPGEAEASWAGAGMLGRWKVRDVQGCSGASNVTIYVTR